jgi:hypothetical protein
MKNNFLIMLPFFQVRYESIRVAKLKTRKNPHISVIVVRTGPDARAGSALKSFIRRGTTPPIDTAITVFKAMARATTIPR